MPPTSPTIPSSSNTPSGKSNGFWPATPSGQLISYRDEKPALREVQDARLLPSLKALEEKHGFRLRVYDTLFDQHNLENAPRLRTLLETYRPEYLLVTEVASGLLKSFGLALLMLHGDLSVREALDLSRLEDRYQYELCGKVEEFHFFEETELYMKLLTLRLLWQSYNSLDK